MSSIAYIQRLQKLYVHLKRNMQNLLGDCCALVELIDEDDLRNWYVLLRYEDENKSEFSVSLRFYFLEELQRMPLVFVIAPRLIATFIHHGAICSLELMSQHWSVDVEGLTLLIHSLHATLNPFSPGSKVTVDEGNSNLHGTPLALMQQHLAAAGDEGAEAIESVMMRAASVSAYSSEEHELGIEYIKQAHPHLFRGYTGGRKLEHPRQREGSTSHPSLVAEQTATTASSFPSSHEIAGTDGNVVACATHTSRCTVHSREELERVFTTGGAAEVELDLREYGGEDGPVVHCVIPTLALGSRPYTLNLFPFTLTEKTMAASVDRGDNDNNSGNTTNSNRNICEVISRDVGKGQGVGCEEDALKKSEGDDDKMASVTETALTSPVRRRSRRYLSASGAVMMRRRTPPTFSVNLDDEGVAQKPKQTEPQEEGEQKEAQGCSEEVKGTLLHRHSYPGDSNAGGRISICGANRVCGSAKNNNHVVTHAPTARPIGSRGNSVILSGNFTSSSSHPTLRDTAAAAAAEAEAEAEAEAAAKTKTAPASSRDVEEIEQGSDATVIESLECKSRLLPNTRGARNPNAPCVIPVGCTLRLRDLTIYAGVTVLGTLELYNCTFVGYVSTEGAGRALLSHCDVYVDGPESRREGILILDASSVEMRDGTTVRRKEYSFVDDHASLSVEASTPFMLHALMLVSNSGSLRMRGGCDVASYGTEKTIFAEQDASVDLSDCAIMAGFSSGVCIQGCRASLTNTRFYGGEQISPHVLDINRPTGLNVELGALITAHHCRAERLYFGFSVIAHSVAHFFGCHADHVVNGYTIDASSVTIENSSARTNHVGIYALNKAKCRLSNDLGVEFDERCRQLLRWRTERQHQQKQKQQQKKKYTGHLDNDKPEDNHDKSKHASGNPNKNGDGNGHGETVEPHSMSSCNSSPAVAAIEATTELEEGENREGEYECTFVGLCSEQCILSPSVTTATITSASISSSSLSWTAATAVAKAGSGGGRGGVHPPLPLSFSGGIFSVEVRDASMVVKGILLSDAQDSSLYIYDQGSLELTEAVVWTTLTSSQASCALKVVNGSVHLHRCLAADYAFGFAATQGSVVRLEECMAIGGTNGFTIDAAQCTLHHCGADTEHVGVFSLNQSTLRVDNMNAPKGITGGLPCVLKGRVYGLESRASDAVCTGVTVQRGLDSGFTCYNGGSLRLERCVVDMNAADSSDTRRQPSYLAMWAAAAAAAPTSQQQHQHQQKHQQPQMSEAVALMVYGGQSNSTSSSAVAGGGGGEASGVSVRDHCTATTVSPPAQEFMQRNAGVKAWSGSRCIVVGCEVRHVIFGYAAIGPETELEASHCTAKHIVNGFTVDSAKCRLSRCSTNSDHVGIFVISHGTCTVRRGNYTARMYGIENRNGVVHIEGHVKLSGFSLIGLYVYDDARLDTEADSLLDIKVFKDPLQQRQHHQHPQHQHFTPRMSASIGGAASGPSGLFPSCFAMDKGTAVIHNAIFGGGAQCAVSCGDGADAYLHQCTAERCNIAFNTLTGAQMYLADCTTNHVWQHALVVHRGGVMRVSSHVPGRPLQGPLQIDGKCSLEGVIMHPAPATEEDDTTDSIQNGSSLQRHHHSPQNKDNKSDNNTNVIKSSNNSNIHSSTQMTITMAAPNGLIQISSGGSLVMEMCNIMLHAPPPRAVVLAEGRRASVRLRSTYITEVNLNPHSRNKNPNFSEDNHSGSGGGEEGEDDDEEDQEEEEEEEGEEEVVASPKPVVLANDAPIDANAGVPQRPRRRRGACALDAFDPTAVCPSGWRWFGLALQRGARGELRGASTPPNPTRPVSYWCVLVGRGARLTATGVPFRRLAAPDAGAVRAVRCCIAGPNAARVCGGSALCATDCAFVGAARGAALWVGGGAAATLTHCRAYATHGVAIAAQHGTLKLMDTHISAPWNRTPAVALHAALMYVDSDCKLDGSVAADGASRMEPWREARLTVLGRAIRSWWDSWGNTHKRERKERQAQQQTGEEEEEEEEESRRQWPTAGTAELMRGN